MSFLLAHIGNGVHGFADGFLHPMTGLDHLLAMVGVGLWATRVASARLVWALPATFVGALAAGFGLGLAGLPLPGVEWAIALSVVALGALIAIDRPMPTAAAFALVALFALCHGHAHGAEVPPSASVFRFGLGMILATAVLHAVGVGLGRLWRITPRATPAWRVAGGAIAGVGILLCAGVV